MHDLTRAYGGSCAKGTTGADFLPNIRDKLLKARGPSNDAPAYGADDVMGGVATYAEAPVTVDSATAASIVVKNEERAPEVALRPNFDNQLSRSGTNQAEVGNCLTCAGALTGD